MPNVSRVTMDSSIDRRLARLANRPQRKRRPFKGPCARCGGEREPRKSAYCRACSATIQRDFYRRSGGYAGLSEEQKRRSRARAYAKEYRRRGLLVPKPCEVCGATEVQMHHDDYDKPLEVRWFCKDHHNSHHREEYASLPPWAPPKKC